MYLHLGGDVVVNKKDIIGIFDLETSSLSKITREYLMHAQKRGVVHNVNYELPTSFTVLSQGKKTTVYTSQISAQTLAKRAETSDFFANTKG